MCSQYQTHGILPTTETTNMADKDKYTKVATLRAAQWKISEPAYNIF
jgi:hypothetical protein